MLVEPESASRVRARTIVSSEESLRGEQQLFDYSGWDVTNHLTRNTQSRQGFPVLEISFHHVYEKAL